MFIRKTLHFFDKLEDHIRAHLSRFPVVYGLIAAVTVVLFWRAVWHTADILEAQGGFFGVIFSPPGQIIINVVVLLATGILVSSFIGDRIILSGLRHEEKIITETEHLEKGEKINLSEIKKELDEIKETIQEQSKII